MSEQAPAITGIAALAVDCHDPQGLARWWSRLHLDPRSSDLAEATTQAPALGATRAGDVYDQGRWQVLRDPEGNEFCILRPRP
jgi:Glyoxalase-like domain